MATSKVIKFYATWCGPCKVYSKTWEEVSNQYNSSIEFVDIDIEKDTTGLAAEYKVMSIPHTVVIKDTGEKIQKGGRLTKEQLTELILS